MKAANCVKRAAAWLLCILLLLAGAGQALAEEVSTPGEAGCDHARHEAVETWEENIRYAANADGITHTKTADVYGKLKCLDCGEICAERELVRADAVSEEKHTFTDGVCSRCEYACTHVYEDGVCTVCGALKPCSHGATAERTEVLDAHDFVSLGSERHEFVADKRVIEFCELCGRELSSTTEVGVTLTEPHRFEDGVCADCGEVMACTHPSLESGFIKQNHRDYEPLGNGQHTCICDIYIYHLCPDCDAFWMDEEPVETGAQAVQSCYYGPEGTCNFCGAERDVCQHPDTVERTMMDVDTIEVVAVNSVYHTYRADIVSYDYCPDCGEWMNKRTVEEDSLFRDTHAEWSVCTEDGNVCELCGYLLSCAHEHISAELYPEYIREVLSSDADGHTIRCSAYKETFCEDCGYLLGTEAIADTEVTMPHDFDSSGECVVCGAHNGCEHENAYVRRLTENVRSVKIVDGQKHSFVCDQYEEWFCPDCVTYGEYKLVGRGVTIEEPHEFDADGVCQFCGAQKAEATPTPRPAATPEPDYDYEPTSRPNTNRTPAPIPVTTVAPTPAPVKKEIVGTLFEAVADAKAEGKDVQVEIVGAQEVMTQEEYTELKALSAQEQVLVTLKSAGLDEVVEAAMSAMKVKLSGEAESLMDKVDARMGTMTAEERTAYEDRLAEYFPVTERIIAGERVRTFTIDMRVVVDGYARVERYQFYLDENGEWIFEKVDLASFGRL